MKACELGSRSADKYTLPGGADFRQDIHRLAVSRMWYSVAWPVLVRHLRLSASALGKFVRHQQPNLAQSRDCIVSVRLFLRDGSESKITSVVAS